MIKLEKIFEIIELALWSGYLKGERPLSILLSAPIEGGKTEAISRYSQNSGVIFESNFTPTGFIRKYGRDLGKGLIKHILIPDLLSPLSKQHYPRKAFITFLNSLTEEGIASIHTMFVQLDVKSPHPVGIVGGITREEFEGSRQDWAKVGFLSRMLPVSWQYKEPTVAEIMEYIMGCVYRGERKVSFSFPWQEREVTLLPEQAKKLTPLSRKLSKVQKTYGFRYQRHFQRLALASALQLGRAEVGDEDLERVEALSEFCNLDFKEI